MSATTLLDLIGNTPLVRLTRLRHRALRALRQAREPEPGRLDQGPHRLSMIEAAERDGRLQPGGTIVEATAGNTGHRPRARRRAKGYALVLVVPDKMSREKIQHLKAMGAEVVMTRSDVGQGPSRVLPGHRRAHRGRTARRVLRQPVRQSGQPAAHERTTGPEIWAQMEHRARRGRLRRRQRRHARRAHALLPQASRRTWRWCSPTRAGSIARRVHADRAASATRARGWSRASARTSCRRSPISRA